jgi:hypothetical protein
VWLAQGQLIVIVAVLLGPELTLVLSAVWPLADQLPEIGSDDPQAAPLGTVPATVTVIDAVAPSASEKPLQLIVWAWFFLLGLIDTVPVLAGLVVAEALDSQPAVPPWSFIACKAPPVQFWTLTVNDQLPDVPGVPVWLPAWPVIGSPEHEGLGLTATPNGKLPAANGEPVTAPRLPSAAIANADTLSENSLVT